MAKNAKKLEKTDFIDLLGLNFILILGNLDNHCYVKKYNVTSCVQGRWFFLN